MLALIVVANRNQNTKKIMYNSYLASGKELKDILYWLPELKEEYCKEFNLSPIEILYLKTAVCLVKSNFEKEAREVYIQEGDELNISLFRKLYCVEEVMHD